jgi:hypothetical protein
MWQLGTLLRGRLWVAILNAQECASAIRTVGLNALPNALQIGDPNRLEFLLDFKLGTNFERITTDINASNLLTPLLRLTKSPVFDTLRP